jgi:hypothetical protein
MELLKEFRKEELKELRQGIRRLKNIGNCEDTIRILVKACIELRSKINK